MTYEETKNGYILWFKDVKRDDTRLVGGKGANLGELVSIGVNVPNGFVVTSLAFKDFLEKNNLKSKILSYIKNMKINDTSNIEYVSKEIQNLILSTDINTELEKEIIKAYDTLSQKLGEKYVKVAVRSSATAEDLSVASFAGMQDTYLYISGYEEVLHYIKKCWASLYSPRVIVYRYQKNISDENVYMGVVIQSMVRSKSAGVMFTVDPITGDPTRIVIEANWGLGESVVSGEVSPDLIIVDKKSRNIIKMEIQEKNIKYDWDPYSKKVVKMGVPQRFRKRPAINNKEIMLLSEYAIRIEDHYGIYMDIEWAIDKYEDFPDKVKIVQARPETIWNRKK